MEIGQSAMESMGMNNIFWKGKKVFVTGHTGFKGSWLCLWLQQLGAEITGYSLKPPTIPNLFEVARLSQNMSSIIGDVRDGDMLARVMRQSAPDIVIHMAAQPLVRRSYVEPVETYSTNVMGVVHLLEAVRSTPSVRAVINVTTDKCYDNKEWVWGYRENEPLGGKDPYSSSKGCSELVTAAYRHSFFNPEKYGTDHQVALATARAGNVIGGGDWAEDRLIPDILRGFEAGQIIDIRSPQALRPWQHVLEPLSGYLMLAEALYTKGVAYSEAFNFGPAQKDAKSVQWIVENLTQEWGNGMAWRFSPKNHPHEAHSLKLDCSKSSDMLGWHPRWNLDIALRAIVSWHKSYLANHDMRTLCLQQVEAYLSA